MSDIREKIQNLIFEIDGDVHHGECFYSKEMLDNFLNNLFQLQLLTVQHFLDNQEDN